MSNVRYGYRVRQKDGLLVFEGNRAACYAYISRFADDRIDDYKIVRVRITKKPSRTKRALNYTMSGLEGAAAENRALDALSVHNMLAVLSSIKAGRK